MATFTPPTQSGAALTGTTPAAKALFSHFGTVTEGRNVYLLTDGTVTETDPSDWSTVSRILYGGHVETVSAAEATLLTANGYGAFLS